MVHAFILEFTGFVKTVDADLTKSVHLENEIKVM
jgi:hypothetical protein